MAQFSAPGIIRQETDLSEIVSPVGTSIGATVGEAEKGIANSRVLLSSDKNYVDTFGEPNSVNLDYSGYAAMEYLKESDALYYVRATQGDETFANMCFDAASGETSATGITALSSTALVATSQYEDGNKSDDIQELEAVSPTGALSASLFCVAAIGPGAYGNHIGVRVTTTSVAVTGGFDWGNAYSSSVTGSVFKIEVFVDAEEDGTFPTDPEETFFVTKTSAKDEAGRQLEMEEVINGKSKYIYVKNLSTSGYPLPTTVVSGVPSVVSLSGGADSAGAVGNGMKESAWSLFTDREKVTINICIEPVDPSTSNAASLQNYVGNTVAAARLDCIAVVQVGASTATVAQTIVDGDTSTSFTSPSYVAKYAGWDKVYDNFNDRNIFIPKCIFGAAVMARTDRLGNTWDAPAGVNRGILPSIGQNIVWNTSDIGTLYDANINTSKFIRGFGNVLWGQKTAQTKKSALDRINVRRLLLYIQNSIEPSLLPFLFEGNTDKTRLRVFSIVDSFLRTVEAGGGVTQYQVVVDESNNTPTVIDQNKLFVDIYVQPTKTIEFIKLQTIITRTGVSFSEV